MNFDDHTSEAVSLAVATVNVLTSGHAHGREYRVEDPARELSSLFQTPRTRDISDSDIDELRDYAGKLRQVFVAIDAGRMDGACELTNTLLSETHAAPVLSRHDGEPWHLHFHALTAGWARGLTASMATGLAMVLGNPMCHRLGVCTAPSCDRVFVDTSRNGMRRFCSTSCQNRVKTATFRARRRVG